MDKSEIIISGPEYSEPELRGSIAQHLVPILKLRPKDSIAQVNYATNESITSHEFLCKCLEITEGLIEFGLKRKEVVVIASSNSIPAIVTAMGIVMSGRILAPIDVSLKKFELQHILKQLQPKYIICEKEKASDFQKSTSAINLDAKIIVLDSSDSGEFYSLNDIKTKVDVENYVPRGVEDPEKDIAVISCSSGSTGMPKGIGLSHSAILTSLCLPEVRSIPEDNRVILFCNPLYWMSGSILTLLSCFYGFTRYVPKSIRLDDTLEAIQMCKPFFIMLTPACLHFMIEHPDFKKYDLSSVKLLVSVGSVLDPILASKIEGVWEGIRIVNLYGLTETCGGITTSDGVNDLAAVGKIRAGAKVKVVDPVTGQSLGPNKIGECRVKSKTLMTGYYNNEEETKAAFDDQGWFRTGDLVYYNEEGIFYVVGRIKDSFSFRNYEISPAEIESFIIGVPGVKDVAVVPVPHELDINHPRALVVKDPNSNITARDIIDGVKENFTERKHLKAGVQFVDALPRSEVGKLRRLEAQKMINTETSKVYFDGTE